MTAPPSPPYVSSPNALVARAIPKAELLVKLECSIVPCSPFQYIAPPDLLAMFPVKLELLTLPYEEPAGQSIAPPLVPATLLVKVHPSNEA